MAIKEILLLGNEDLYRVSAPVKKEGIGLLKKVIDDLNDTMMEFRRKHGVGRAIAAPQIGVHKRLIYMNIDAPRVFINPEITFKSAEMMELWDDCMSFPDLLVKVRRHKEIKIQYTDLAGERKSDHFRDDLSELFQHEYDHLDGILAISRAIDDRSFALKGTIDITR
jgi:peptide deformylase